MRGEHADRQTFKWLRLMPRRCWTIKLEIKSNNKSLCVHVGIAQRRSASKLSLQTLACNAISATPTQTQTQTHILTQHTRADLLWIIYGAPPHDMQKFTRIAQPQPHNCSFSSGFAATVCCTCKSKSQRFYDSKNCFGSKKEVAQSHLAINSLGLWQRWRRDGRLWQFATAVEFYGVSWRRWWTARMVYRTSQQTQRFTGAIYLWPHCG